MLVENAGFDLSRLSAILALPEAGRTQSCLDAWTVVTESEWVLNIIKMGVTWA